VVEGSSTVTDSKKVSLDAVTEKAKEVALRSLGLAVFAIQAFEVTFALVYLGHRTALKMGDKFTPVVDMGDPDYRTTTTSHIKNLQQAGRIDTKLAARLSLFVDRRHELIHRWTILHGWPVDDDPVKWIELMTACAWIVGETTKLVRLLSKHVGRLDGETDAAYAGRQAEIFKLAGAAARLPGP
jgi:hypothetical protein